jgi:hypothetical protein
MDMCVIYKARHFRVKMKIKHGAELSKRLIKGIIGLPYQNNDVLS